MKRLVLWMMLSLLALTLRTAGAVEIVLGAGDVLKVSVYGSPDLALETRVSDTGTITFPLIGQVAVGGLPVPVAEKKIADLLEGGGFVKKAQVNILVTMIQSQQVSVLGQVTRPGRYPMDGKRKLMDMLAQAGGIGLEGGDTVSVIRTRNGRTTREVVDIIEMVHSGDFAHDYELAADDVLYVERAPRFYIYGEVLRPGPLRLERNMTVLQALSAGGGLTPRGTERGMRIKRRDASGKLQVIDAKHDDLVQVDDVVYVKESLF
ncbi:MAG: polysaccharide export protein EpsE [Pseudomonadota bacterium]